MNPKPSKPAKSGLLKARCEPDLEQWYEGLAYVRKLDVADVVRFALRDFQQRTTSNPGLISASQEQHRQQ